MKVLLVEDDPNFGIVLKTFLEQNGYDIHLAVNGAIGWNEFNRQSFDLCILDVMMPEMDGFTLANKILKKNKSTPLIFLTAKSLKEDIIKGYKLGAKDYITKPFDPDILLLKIESLMTSINGRESQSEIEFLDYKYLSGKRDLCLPDGNKKRLSPREGELLKLLLLNKNNLINRDEVLGRIWSESNYFTARSMDVYINKLRNLFSNDSRINIENIHGKGFVFEVKD